MCTLAKQAHKRQSPAMMAATGFLDSTTMTKLASSVFRKAKILASALSGPGWKVPERPFQSTNDSFDVTLHIIRSISRLIIFPILLLSALAFILSADSECLLDARTLVRYFTENEQNASPGTFLLSSSPIRSPSFCLVYAEVNWQKFNPLYILNFSIYIANLFLDFVVLTRYPKSSTIPLMHVVFHHIVTGAGWCFYVYRCPRMAMMNSYATQTDWNMWLQIIYYFKKGPIVRYPFYVTWVICRLMLPIHFILALIVFHLLDDPQKSTNNAFHASIMCAATLGIFGLYLKWTKELIEKLDRKPRAVLLVDPYSTGRVMAKFIADRKVVSIILWSDPKNPVLAQKRFERVPWYLWIVTGGELVHGRDLESTMQDIRSLPFQITAVIGCTDTGIELANQVSEGLGLTFRNNIAVNSARRAKVMMSPYATPADAYLMSNSMMQKKVVSTAEEGLAFFQGLQALRGPSVEVILRPLHVPLTLDTAVGRCTSLEEVAKKIHAIQEELSTTSQILVQETVHGNQYLVETLSKDGEHKVIAVWRGFGKFNGRESRYSEALQLLEIGVCLDNNGDITEGIKLLGTARNAVSQVLKALDSTGVRNGAACTEIWLSGNGETLLVEVSSRCHGSMGSFIPLVEDCLGQKGKDQVSCLVDLALKPSSWDKVPKVMNEKLVQHGISIEAVPKEATGQVLSINLGELSRLPSFKRCFLMPNTGDIVPPASEDLTGERKCGYIHLAHESKEQLEKDFVQFQQYLRGKIVHLSLSST